MADHFRLTVLSDDTADPIELMSCRAPHVPRVGETMTVADRGTWQVLRVHWVMAPDDERNGDAWQTVEVYATPALMSDSGRRVVGREG